MLLLRKTWVLDQELQWPQIPETTCGTSFSLPSLEESHCMALILYENSFKSFDGTAEDSDNPLWTANWYNDFWGLFPFECQQHPIYIEPKYDIVIFFFSPALNKSLNFSSILYIILWHSKFYVGYILTKLLVAVFYNTHFAKGMKWTAFNGLYFSEVLTTCTLWHNPQLGTCLTY
jgi:hypothetical protein